MGALAGWIGSKIFEGQGQGFMLNVVLGIVGAVVGGFIFSALGATGVTGFNLWSLIVAVVGAVVVLWLYNKMAANR
nr:GlsB/YeaQ/YmgE family stress response membrane protein [Variibacter gotjawalensis]